MRIFPAFIVKDQTITVSQLIASKIGKLGENIAVRRFARFKVGEPGATVAFLKPDTQGGDEAGPAPAGRRGGPRRAGRSGA